MPPEPPFAAMTSKQKISLESFKKAGLKNILILSSLLGLNGFRNDSYIRLQNNSSHLVLQ